MHSSTLSFILALFVYYSPAVSQSQKEPHQVNRQYFPAGIFGRLTEYKENLYSSTLVAMEEPSLLESAKTGVHAYRLLLIVPATTGVAVRLTLRPDGTGILDCKEIKTNRFQADSISSKTGVAVSEEYVQQFLKLLQRADFSKMKTEEVDGKNRYAMDGIFWVLEGTRNGDYHVVERWSANETDFAHACSYLLELYKKAAKSDGDR